MGSMALQQISFWHRSGRRSESFCAAPLEALKDTLESSRLNIGRPRAWTPLLFQRHDDIEEGAESGNTTVSLWNTCPDRIAWKGRAPRAGNVSTLSNRMSSAPFRVCISRPDAPLSCHPKFLPPGLAAPGPVPPRRSWF